MFLCADHYRLHRSEQVAGAAAALDHPNISEVHRL